MRIHYAVAALLAAALLAGCGEKGIRNDRGADTSAVADTPVANRWLSFNEGMALAEKERRPVIIDFYTSWCHWCKVMDRETFSEPDVKRYLAENFVSIRIDAENKTDSLYYRGENFTPVGLGRRFGVRGFPSLAYLDAEQELVTVVPGFVPAETFLSILQYMKKECYKQRMTFEEYLRRKGDCDPDKSGA